MMQPGIFNRLFTKFNPVIKIIGITLFVLVIVLPANRIHAANTNPQPAGASTACSTTNITDDQCYINNCTGQATDSQTCQLYAQASATRDHGTKECSAIDTTNDTECCAADSPMCIAYHAYLSKNLQKQAAAAPATPTTLNVAGASINDNGMGLIPCDGDDCTINSVMKLMNNIMTFFFKTLLLPIFVVMIMYLGFQYLTAQGKPGMHAKIGSMAKHMVLGLLLILLAFVIVRTIMTFLGYTDTFNFFG